MVCANLHNHDDADVQLDAAMRTKHLILQPLYDLLVDITENSLSVFYLILCRSLALL